MRKVNCGDLMELDAKALASIKADVNMRKTERAFRSACEASGTDGQDIFKAPAVITFDANNNTRHNWSLDRTATNGS